MELGERIKQNYEETTNFKINHRSPAIIRIDGKSFHTEVKRIGAESPFDLNLTYNLLTSTLELCKKIMNVKLAYLQSDEISLLLIDYEREETEAWFNRRLQKMTSVSAGLMSAYMSLAYQRPLIFDSRVFNIPPFEVCNYFIWRQKDAERNSMNSVARHFYSEKEIHGISNEITLQKIADEQEFYWANIPTIFKRGACIYRGEDGKYQIDSEIPQFTKDRNFINQHVPELRDEINENHN